MIEKNEGEGLIGASNRLRGLEASPRQYKYKQGLTLMDHLGVVLESVLIRRIQGIGYGVLRFLGVGTTFDIFQNIHILYLQYDILVFSGYGVLNRFPLWHLVSSGTDMLYLP
ncbi:hypothetical protein Tco_1056340 [Tanacetum coccineum]|uniref:Uncharacterized protein n=1 Tax=Tanacetum coccineum TaxID=301880 RepID=A0ABQ5H4J9_9ASTR